MNVSGMSKKLPVLQSINCYNNDWKEKMKFKTAIAAIFISVALIPLDTNAAVAGISNVGPDAANYISAANQQMSILAATLQVYPPKASTAEEIMIQKAFDIYKFYGVDLDAIIPRLQGILPQILTEPDRYGAIVGEDIAAWRLDRQSEYASEYGTQLVFNYYRSTGLTPEQALEATQIAYGMR